MYLTKSGLLITKWQPEGCETYISCSIPYSCCMQDMNGRAIGVQTLLYDNRDYCVCGPRLAFGILKDIKE
jgi:hypothetical protein